MVFGQDLAQHGEMGFFCRDTRRETNGGLRGAARGRAQPAGPCVGKEHLPNLCAGGKMLLGLLLKGGGLPDSW